MEEQLADAASASLRSNEEAEEDLPCDLALVFRGDRCERCRSDDEVSRRPTR